MRPNLPRSLRSLPPFLGALAAVAALASPAAAEITLYEHFDYRGASRSFRDEVADLRREGFNDKASSFRIDSGTWELCREIDFRDCRTFRDDEDELPRAWNDTISSLRRVGRGRAEIEVFEHWNYRGARRTFDAREDDLRPSGWNDRISSIRVVSGRWEICRDVDLRDCREIGSDDRELRGNWNDSISSLRPLRPFRDD
jgi:hypothetical protein